MTEPVIYRASELGGCLKLMVAKRLGYPQMDQSKVKTKAGVELQELYDEGTRLEDVVLRRLYDEGWRCQHYQMELNLQVTDKVIIQGHIDAFQPRVERRNPLLVEIKSMRPASFNSTVEHGWSTPGLLQKYKWQLSAYVHELRFRYNDNSIEAVLVIIDSDPSLNDDDRRIHYLYTENPHYSLADLRERVLVAESWAKRGELPVACDRPSFPCPVWYLHEDEDIEVISDEVIDKVAVELKEVQKGIKVLQDREKEARKILTGLRDSQPGSARSSKKKVLDNGEEVVLESVKVRTERSKVSWYEQMNPPSFDRVAAEADGVDLGKYKKQDKSWRLRVEVEDEESN